MERLVPWLWTPQPQKIIDVYCSHKITDGRLLYRFEIAVENCEGQISTRVYRRMFSVSRETPHMWVFDAYGQERRVLKGDGKRYAHETEERALFSLRKRTRWRQSHALWALTQSHEAIDAYNELFAPTSPIEKVGQP